MATNLRKNKMHKFIETGAGNISLTITPGYAFRLISFDLHLSGAGGATNLTITRDAGDGAAYDTVAETVDMTSIVNYIKTWDNVIFDGDDSLVVAWVNGSSRTYGLTIRVEELY